MQQLLLDLLPPPAPTFDNFVHGRNAEAVTALRGWLEDPRGPTCFLLWGELHSGRGHLARALSDWRDGVPALAAQSFQMAFSVDALDDAGQVELFKAFNRLKMAGGRLLATSQQPPAAMKVREDLRTRLGSGLVYRLHALSDEEKRAALIDRAGERGLRLSDEVVDYIFRHGRRDLGSLMALLDALDRFTLQHKRALTLPLLRTLLQRSLEIV
jgi:DnaA-homolog protein